MNPSRPFRAAATISLLATILNGSARAGELDDAVRKAAVGVNPPGTIFRVGLSVGHRLMLSSDQPYRLINPATGELVWKESYAGELALIAQGGPEEEPASVYRIQVGAFASAEAAELERASLERATGAPAVVRYIPDRGSWRVRVGEAKTRTGLATLLATLRDAGRKGLWIAEETAAAPPGVTIRLVDAAWETMATNATRLIALPAGSATLQLEGKPYRGALEFRVDASGRLRAVNWVELESYLRAVVPSELGPEVWPQLEALKAQAVAARTYALANALQFDEDGYDICATPRCQAYGGASAEHPLSDRAVAQTRGEIATWQGRPIDALYTATCGGHTEDAKEIFPEQAAPYLTGVPCRAEDQALARTRRLLKGASTVAVETEYGEDVTRDVILLDVVGVFGPPGSTQLVKELGKPIKAEKLRDWTTRLSRLAGRPAPTGAPIEPSTLGKAALALASDLGWTERTEVLLTNADLDAVLRDPKAALLPPGERRALTYLVQQGLLRPARDGRLVLDRAPSGATIAAALARVGEAYKVFDLDEGTVVSADPRSLSIIRGQGSATLPLTPAPRLFTVAGPRNFPVGSLQLWPGDRVRYHLDRDGRIDLLELRPPTKGVSDDRSAAVYAWEVRKTGAELEEAIDKRVSVGTLSDLRVVRRGVSGRIVELAVIGSKGSTVVKGFDVRNLLDLRESLTVIELQRDPSGRISSAVFAGKGWGHGVGLCQVGAYGMAMRGSDYKSILAHYYPGATLSNGGSPAFGGCWRTVIATLYSGSRGSKREEIRLDGSKTSVTRCAVDLGDHRAVARGRGVVDFGNDGRPMVRPDSEGRVDRVGGSAGLPRAVARCGPSKERSVCGLRPFHRPAALLLPRSSSRDGERHEGRVSEADALPSRSASLAGEVGPPILVVCGPTGTGKSQLAARVARRLGGEVVSCDALQVYRGLDAGTAKPTPGDRERVPHWLVDVADPRHDYSLADYVRDADAAIASIVSRGRVPVVVGGTGMYLRGLLKGIVATPPRNAVLRARLTRLVARFGAPRLHRLLAKLDPATSKRVGPEDAQRIVRAIELAQSSGPTWSTTLEQSGTWSSATERYRALKFGLDLDRDILAARLAARVDAFFEADLAGEIDRLLSSGVPETANAFKGIGYREILRTRAAGLSALCARDAIVVATRQYAKRQRTWFRKEPGLVWLDAKAQPEALADTVVAAWNAKRGKEGAASPC